MLGEGEWKTKKLGAESRRQWRKVHLGIDASTLEIRAMEATDNSVGDAPVLPGCLIRFLPKSALPALVVRAAVLNRFTRLGPSHSPSVIN